MVSQTRSDSLARARHAADENPDPVLPRGARGLPRPHSSRSERLPSLTPPPVQYVSAHNHDSSITGRIDS